MDELIVATQVFDVKDRIKSVNVFAKIMGELNLGK